jgi:hypothetical protein
MRKATGRTVGPGFSGPTVCPRFGNPVPARDSSTACFTFVFSGKAIMFPFWVDSFWSALPQMLVVLGATVTVFFSLPTGTR